MYTGKFSRQLSLLFGVFLTLALSSVAQPVKAAEYGKGIYLLGTKGPMAGVLPPPGTYLTFIDFVYSGDATGAAANGVALDPLGNLTLEANLEVDATLVAKLPFALWVAPWSVWGGNVAFGAILPIGYQEIDVNVDALATLTLRNGRTFQRGQRFEIDDDTTSIGDPLATAQIGWHQGNWHWNFTGLLNIPIGQYSENNLANWGFNRWAFDASGSVTWLDPTRGHEVSVTTGFTFNGENPDTDYRTGTEFHVEFALQQHFSKAFAIGIVGYHYSQVTGDSGAGATLGDFKGRISGIGPNINFNFKLGQIPVATTLRWYREFDAKNRLEGDAGFLTVTIPLAGPAG